MSDFDKFVSKKRDNYLDVNISIVNISIIVMSFGLLYISYLFITAIVNNKFYYLLIIIFISMVFFIWMIYNLVKEHYVYKANFVSTKTEIIFKSILYKKEIKWTEVINIKMDIMMPVSSYLPYNETRCIVLELKNGDKHKILNGGYKNIDDFKVYLKNNFSGKIIFN